MQKLEFEIFGSEEVDTELQVICIGKEVLTLFIFIGKIQK